MNKVSLHLRPKQVIFVLGVASAAARVYARVYDTHYKGLKAWCKKEGGWQLEIVEREADQMNHEPILHIQIEAPTLADLRAFTDEIRPADLGCRAIPRQIEGQFVLDAYLPEPQLQAARDSRTASRVSLRVIENATEIGRERQREVGEGNRFASRGQVPRGLGRKE